LYGTKNPIIVEVGLEIGPGKVLTLLNPNSMAIRDSDFFQGTRHAVEKDLKSH
jgi:hypothetical protein